MSPRASRALSIAAVVGGLFTWAMVVVGLSFAMIEHGARQWWMMPVFGALMAVLTVFAVSRVPTPAGVVAPRRAAVVAGGRVLAEPLSPREVEVLQQLASGRSNREIAKALYVAPGTVKAHLHHIFRKLEAASRLQAVAHAREAGLIEEINPR
jgi:DNA-binding CsgD family transcriptional regulator